jgi:HEPN domain-containing protein
MEAPREKVLRKVGEWLARADEDLQLATYALTMQAQAPPYRLVAYHAQQCAEKCLKAFLVYHNVEFPYTHNIRRLLTLCESYAMWTPVLREAEELTAYAITVRCPGEDTVVTEEEARRSVSVAERVRGQVRTALRELGMELD